MLRRLASFKFISRHNVAGLSPMQAYNYISQWKSNSDLQYDRSTKNLGLLCASSLLYGDKTINVTLARNAFFSTRGYYYCFIFPPEQLLKIIIFSEKFWNILHSTHLKHLYAKWNLSNTKNAHVGNLKHLNLSKSNKTEVKPFFSSMVFIKYIHVTSAWSWKRIKL